MQLIERQAPGSSGLRERGLALLALAVFDDVARFGFVRHLELVARFGHALQSEHFDRSGRPSFLDRLPAIVEHRANFAVHRADDEHIAHVQACRSAPAQSPPARGLYPRAIRERCRCRRVGIGLEFAQIADEQNHFEQARKIFLGSRGDFHHHRIAAPFFRHQAAVGELALYAFGLRIGLVDFIDGDDDWHIRGSRVRDGFFGLRHHAVVGCHHEDDDVGNLCAARAHARERFVARRVDENDSPVAHVRFVRADVLRDSARFAGRNFGFADRVEQAGFAVVHVAHHGDHRSARQQISGALFLDFFFLHHLLFEGDHLHDSVESFGEACCGGNVERLVDAGENAAVEQGFQQILGANIQLFGQFADRDAFGNRDVPRLALHGGHRFGVSRASCSDASARANRMQLALAFGEALFDRRAPARSRWFSRI